VALPPALALQLETALVALGMSRASTTLPSAPGKALELWLVMRIAAHFKAQPGWAATLCDGAGSPLAASMPFLMRAQPGPISARLASAPGFVQITRAATPGAPAMAFELHGSLQFTGRSSARHELDISVITDRVGQAIRTGGGGRPVGLPIASVECKHHVADGPLGEVREKVARLFDLTFLDGVYPRNGHQLFWPGDPAAHWGTRDTRYIDVFGANLCGIARSTGFQIGAERLADHYSVRRYDQIFTSASLAGLLGDLVACLDAA
jgi:hypothetical protein